MSPNSINSMISVLRKSRIEMTSSEWRLERNRRSLERLERALPRIFPVPVLVHAFGRPLIPPLPRLAVDSYWRAHPLRADRLARALAAKTGAPSGWTWTVSNSRKDGPTFRIPPAPYREAPFKLGPGRCCICGQPSIASAGISTFGLAGPTETLSGTPPAFAAWRLWIAPRTHLQFLKRLQLRRHPVSSSRAAFARTLGC
jgi:hypothetical protein